MSPVRLLFCSRFTRALRPGKLGCRHNFGFNGTAKTAANIVPGAKHRRRGPNSSRWNATKKAVPRDLLTHDPRRSGISSVVTYDQPRSFRRRRLPLLIFFLSFFLSPSSSPFLSPSRNSLRRYASQERRAAVEQRTDINNPEFPTDVLIIRFQGPPILAGSRARKRIFLSSSRRTRSLPLPFSSSPFHDPLLSRTVSFLPSPLPVSSSISSARFLSRGTPSASKFASRSKQRGTLPPLEMRVAYLWPKTVVRAYKESERGEGRPQMGHEKCGERAYVYDKRPLLYRPRNWKRTNERGKEEDLENRFRAQSSPRSYFSIFFPCTKNSNRSHRRILETPKDEFEFLARRDEKVDLDTI